MARLTSNALIVPSHYKDEEPRIILLFECWQALQEPITEVEGATVGTLVEILRGDVDFYSRILDCPNLEAFLDEPPPGGEDEKPLKSVEFYTYIERWAGHKWNHKDGDLEIMFGASGVGVADEHDVEYGIPAGSIVNNYALDFTPLSSLLALPIVVNGEVKLFNNQRLSRKKTEYTNTVIGNHHMRLIDVLYALVDEIGFHGSPETRSERLGDIEKSVEEIKRGEAEAIPWEDVKKRIEEKLGPDEEDDDEEGEHDAADE